jgi:hypothetical protein
MIQARARAEVYFGIEAGLSCGRRGGTEHIKSKRCPEEAPSLSTSSTMYTLPSGKEISFFANIIARNTSLREEGLHSSLLELSHLLSHQTPLDLLRRNFLL